MTAEHISAAAAKCIYRHNHVRTEALSSGAQAVTFGCVDHHTTQCSYDANEAAVAGAGYDEALGAFTACSEAGVSDGYCHVELDRAS
eukprot:SAG22_NODE_20900_length_261_cov_1.895062_1_plen_86_part_11